MRTHSPASAASICIAIFACIALPLILHNYDQGRAYYDQMTYHYPAIRHFLAGGDFRDYSSATTPGFHLLLAAVARLISDSERVLKLASFLITVALIGWVALRVARQVSDRTVAVILILPLLLSIYFLPSGVWLLPDNLAWLSVFCALVLAQEYRDEGTWYVLVSITLAAAVFVRQSNAWLCAVACAVALAPTASWSDLDGIPRRLIRVSLAIAPCLGVLVYFVRLWHGSVPPSFAEKHAAINFAAAPYFLAVVGFYGLFYLPVIWGPVVRASRHLLWWGALAGLTVGASSPTDWDQDAGRVSGLWNLARLLPSVAHRSVLIVSLAAFGGSIGAALLALASRRDRVIAAVAAVGFVAAQTLSHFVYERYYAGFVFLIMILLVADIARRVAAVPRWALAGPAALALLNACVLAAGLWAHL
jgi:hypothetical protein